MATTNMMTPIEELFKYYADTKDENFMKEMAKLILNLLMDAEVTPLIGAEKYQRSEDRNNSRNGTRKRPFSSRMRNLELKVPKLRQGSYFPCFLGSRRMKVIFAGICGSDIHIFHDDIAIPMKVPVVTGHEFSGIIDKFAIMLKDFAVTIGLCLKQRSVFVGNVCIVELDFIIFAMKEGLWGTGMMVFLQDILLFLQTEHIICRTR